MNIIKRVTLVAAIAASTPTFAQLAGVSVQEINRGVLKAATNYANGISCVDAPATAKDILALKPIRTPDDASEAEFLVTWVGDIGCNGGSGTVGTNFAIVKVGSGGSFYVDPLRSSPAISVALNTRFVERLVGNTRDTIVVDAADFGPNDSNQWPTLRFRYTLKVDAKGNWKQVERKPLPPRKG
ncbi:hypothetical protein BXU06_08450 [Aquaspirillum sp. LM1]|uniref:hypothetical protein n=1 Tax=Aquaspirillum sp. LM1 TaxID=1938604 RepID=UPI00098403EE|nr:hypothetical protein [Aquaspirillum sp. LM1]AQR65088.1 hypothetical protein BXU06_08450 [Aquaspirillum sp. LM1]